MQRRLLAMTPIVMRSKTLEIMREHQATAIGMNTDQLFAGELANGDKLPEYSPLSVQVHGKRPGPWQLYDTGDFYSGWFMNAQAFPIVFGSKDGKTLLIMRMVDAYKLNPDEIFGLNKQNFREIARLYALPDLQAFIRRQALRI